MKLSEENQRKVEKNLGLVHKVINDKVHGPYQLGIYTREDLFQIGCIGLCKAAATDKGGNFSTYAYRLIWNQICDALIYSTRRQANETTYDVTPYTAEQDDTDIELGIAIDQALDKHGGTRSCGCKAMEHITDLRKQDITGERFGRLTAVRPTEQRDNNGSVIWELRCDCGNLTYKTVNALKSGRVLSCGCKYRETRSETVKHRRDMVEGTNVSNIVVSKHLRSNNTSGHTGVGLDRRTGKWYAYINFQKKHYNLGLHKDKSAAIRARRAAEARLHDPVILEYWDSLTEKRKKEFQDYLRSTNK